MTFTREQMVAITTRIKLLAQESPFGSVRQWLIHHDFGQSALGYARIHGGQMGERMLFATCSSFKVPALWVLFGQGPRDAQPDDWPNGKPLSPHICSLVRGAMQPLPESYVPLPAKGYKMREPGKPLLMWEAPCCVCGGRVQHFSKARARTTATPTIPAEPCCGKPACKRVLMRRRWDRSFADKIKELGFVPCRGCWTNAPAPGRTYCPKCTARSKESMVERAETKVIIGVCGHPGCTNPLKPDSGLCHMHHEIKAEHMHAESPGLKAIRWSLSPEERRIYDVKHLQLRREHARWMGLCLYCGKPAVDPDARWPVCPVHRRLRSSKRRVYALKSRYRTTLSIRRVLAKVVLPNP